MIKTLKIKNVALINDAELDFDDKLNIISGETGAGKSITLDAINLLLGAKSDKTLIKSGEDFLKVEGCFIDNRKEIEAIFNELDLEYDETIIISRKISTDNKNEIKINGQIVPLMYLKKLGAKLIDIHSQNENLSILNKNNQLELIDKFGKTDFKDIKEKFCELQEINKKISELDKDESIRERELDLLTYQIDEIENAKISENEEEMLENEKILMKNAEKIAVSLNNAKEYYKNGAYSISSLIKKLNHEVDNLLKYDNACESLSNRISSCEIELEDVFEELESLFTIEFNEERLNEIDERLDKYKSLHKKYGDSYENIIKFLDEAKEKKEYLINFADELEKLNKEKKELLKYLYNLSCEISQSRQKNAKILETKILDELKELSMPHAQIKFVFENFEQNFENLLTNKGADNVQILFSANLGEKPNPLNLVASGGEISRLMLAIKTITSENDNLSAMIFDELDTGISGEASIATSKKLAKISRNHQIIAISHLFQICAMADKNILVKKIEKNGKTISNILEVKSEEKINELCRFLSVGSITESVVKHAKEVVEFCENYKKSL